MELVWHAIMDHMGTFATGNVLVIATVSVIRGKAYVEAVQNPNTVFTVIKHVLEIVKQVSVKGIVDIVIIVR